MSKYALGYKLNGVVNRVDLTRVDCLRNKDITDIRTIDCFTKSFDNKEHLLNYLKSLNIIDDIVNDVFVVKEKKDKNSSIKIFDKIYKGEVLFFKNDSDYLDLSFLCIFLVKILNNGEFIKNLAETYYKKYNKKRNGPGYINSTLVTLMRIGDRIKNGEYDSLTPSDLKAYRQCLDNFIIFEFYKYDYNYLSGQFIRKTDKDGNYTNDINIRTFGIYVKEYLMFKKSEKYTTFKNVKEEKKEEIDEDDHEEFLTQEDFDIVNEQILSTYKEDKEGPYEDGVDYIKPLTKKELKSDLNNIAKKLVIKGDAYR